MADELVYRQWLFLDFDGVTHPFFPRADVPESENQFFAYLPTIEAVLRLFPETGVVIASSWREKWSLEELRKNFAPDMRDRIVDVTPVVPIPWGETDRGSRQREVEAWLESRGQSNAPWVALDDTVWLYRPGATVVVAPDRFSEVEAEALRQALQSPEAYAQAHPVPGVSDRSSSRPRLG